MDLESRNMNMHKNCDEFTLDNVCKEWLLEQNNTLLSKERFFQGKGRADSDFVNTIFDTKAANTDGLEKMSKEFPNVRKICSQIISFGRSFQ